MSFDNQDNNNSDRSWNGAPQSGQSPSPYRPPETHVVPPNPRTPAQPPYYGYTSYKPASPDLDEPKQKKGGGVLKTFAMFIAVAIIAGASGGGVTYVMMKNDAGSSIIQQDPPAQEVSSSSASSSSSSSSVQQALPPIAGGTYDLADIIETAAQSVVEIEIEVMTSSPFFGEYATTGGGSGIILTPDGYIATNNHVTQDATKITVRTSDGTEYEATLVGSDSQTDLAVIKIDGENLLPVTTGDSDNIRVGEVAIAIGNPLGTLGGTVTTGIISAKEREVTFDTGETMYLIQTSAAVNPGNSGGGLFDSNGKLIGIVNAKPSGSTEGLGFAIPVNLVKEVTNDIVANGYVTGRPEIGITPLEILNAQDAFRYRVTEFGVYVYEVTRDNGLAVGDLIKAIDGEAVESRADIMNALSNKKPGDIMVFVVMRDGAEVTVNVTLAEKIPDEIRAQMEAAKPF